MNAPQKKYLEAHFFIFWNCGEFDIHSALKRYFLRGI